MSFITLNIFLSLKYSNKQIITVDLYPGYSLVTHSI